MDSSQDESTLAMVSPELLEKPPPCSKAKEVFGNKWTFQLILKAFGEFASSKEIKMLRLVCKEWNEEVKFFMEEMNWKNRTFVVLKDYQDIENYTKTFFPSVNLNTMRYRKSGSGPGPGPSSMFKCFKLKLLNKEGKQQIPVKFFRGLYPNCVKSLNLSLEVTLSGTSVQTSRLNTILMSQSSSLKELKISVPIKNKHSRGLAPKEDEFNLPHLDHFCLRIGEPEESLLGLLRVPNWLRTLVFEKFLKKLPEGKQIFISLISWSDLAGTIGSLQKFNQIDHLKVLDVHFFDEGEELKSLAKAGVKLESLSTMGVDHFVNGDLETDTENVYEFLCTQVRNLKKLSWGSNKRFKFPVMPMTELNQLKLTCFRLRSEELDYENEPIDEEEEEDHTLENLWNRNCPQIIYSDLFPKLEELHLESGDEWVLPVQAFKTWFLPEQPPCESLRKLVINYGEMNLQVLQPMARTFPHITSLKIGDMSLSSRNDETNFFNGLWGAEFAASLQEFCITLTPYDVDRGRIWEKGPIGRYELDSLFSGLSEEVIEEAMDSYTSKIETIIPQQTLSLLNFKNLKTLKVKGVRFNIKTPVSARKSVSTFTDFSAYAVFAKLENLASLVLEEDLYTFSYDACVDLKNTLLSVGRTPYQTQCSSKERLECAFRTDFESLANPWKIEPVCVNFRDWNFIPLDE